MRALLVAFIAASTLAVALGRSLDGVKNNSLPQEQELKKGLELRDSRSEAELNQDLTDGEDTADEDKEAAIWFATFLEDLLTSDQETTRVKRSWSSRRRGSKRRHYPRWMKKGVRKVVKKILKEGAKEAIHEGYEQMVPTWNEPQEN